MKRLLLATVLTLSLCFSLTGCGGAEAKNEAATEQTEDKKEAAAEKPEEEQKSDEQETNTADESLFSSDDTSDKVEESPEASTPAERPTSRTAICRTGEFDETIEYHDDGSYTVTRSLYDSTRSVDCITTYSKRAEVIDYRIRYYDAKHPDGVDGKELKAVMGYPVESLENGQVDTDCIADGSVVVNGDKVEKSTYQNIGIEININAHIPNVVYTLDDLDTRDMKFIENIQKKGIEGLDTTSISDLKWGSQYSDKEAIIYAYYEAEGYDAKARQNTTLTVYPIIDVIKYNDLDMVESIEAYRFADYMLKDVTLNNLDEYKPAEWVYYEYDNDGNLIKEDGQANMNDYVYTYDYGNGSSSTTNNEESGGDEYYNDDEEYETLTEM